MVVTVVELQLKTKHTNSVLLSKYNVKDFFFAVTTFNHSVEKAC